ncbi:MAG: helicase-related protein [Candidatus Pacearchaeota archaeon]
MPELRAYQKAILETAKQKNTLVILPTGLGKTLIAFELINYRLKYFAGSEGKAGKALFLAPTKPLVDQHFSNFKKSYSWESHMLTGAINAGKRKEIWEKARVIFATPQTIANDLRNGLINLDSVTVIVFDEAHRCLKNYDYVYIAQLYKERQGGLILGLTASPGEERAKIEQICSNLSIQAVELRTRESPDVRPYLKRMKIKIIKVSMPQELQEIREKLNEYYSKKIDELRNRGFLLKQDPSKKDIIELQKRLQNEVKSSKNFNLLKALTACAIALKLQHGLELLETQSISALYAYLQDLFEQARQKKSKAVLEMIRNKSFNDAFLRVVNCYNNGKEHPKLEKLKEIVSEEIKANPSFKAIIFTQYRDNVTKLSSFLESFGIKNRPFIGQAKKRDIGLSQREQRAIIEQFKRGEINVLVSTSVGEEGLDLPEVDAVIFYEPVPSAIRKIQRQGRTARTKEGRVLILMAEKTRDEGYYWAAFHKENKMHRIIDKIDEKLNKKEKEKKEKENLTLKNFL